MYLRLLNIYLFKNILTSSINRFVSGKWHNNGFSFLQNNKDDADDKSLFMITIKIFRHEYYASLAKWLRVRLRTNWLWVRISFLSLKTSDMAPAASKEVLNIQANYRVWIHSETRTLHDNKIQSLSAPHACSGRDQINWFGHLMAWNKFAHMNSTTSHSGLSED